MPGIVAVFQPGASRHRIQIVADDVARAMYGSPDYQGPAHEVSERLQIRFVGEPVSLFGSAQLPGLTAMWYGEPRTTDTVLSPESFHDLLDKHDSSDLANWAGKLVGHFQMLLYFERDNVLYMVADRVSSMPIYWVHFDGLWLLSPEALSFGALRDLGWTPGIRESAIYEFISSGYLWGNGTYWNEVQRLGPGQVARMNGREVDLYWHWKFEVNPVWRNWREGIDALTSAIHKDIDAMPRGRAILTLSGGYDSRALLGLLNESGRDVVCLGYSFGDQYQEKFDHEVGQYYAKKLGVKHESYHADLADAGRLIQDIDGCIRATGGECDVVASQDSFLGADFYRRLADSYDFLVRGDEVWGWGDRVFSRQMAFWQVLLFAFNQMHHPRHLLSQDAYHRGEQILQEQRDRAFNEYNDVGWGPNDLKDFLYWRHRESRLLQTMAYYRRCFIPHYAPFVFGNAMEVIRKSPYKMRTRKQLFISAMRESYPTLFLDSHNPTKMIPTRSRFRLMYEQKLFKPKFH